MPVPKMLNIAHRGARSIAPENTLLAAQRGLEIGADLWELDVALTSDGVPVVLHDDSLLRTSDVRRVYPARSPWKIYDFTYAELKKLDFGSWYLKQDPFGQIRRGNVPTSDQMKFKNIPVLKLEEALEFTKKNHWRVNIEIKDMSGTPGDALIVKSVYELVTNYQMVSDILISSFNHQYIIQAKNLLPEVKTGALVVFPDPDPIELLKRTGAASYNPGLEGLNYQQIPVIRQAGYDVLVWTVNDPGVMIHLAEAGVSGIFTDFPQRLKTLLD